MKKITSISSTLLLISTIVLLAGCSREPSENDIKTAYTNEVEQTNNLTRKFGGDAMTIKVNDLKKLSCKESNDKGQFQCRVDLDSTLPIIGRHAQQTTLTLIKDDIGNGKQGWVIVRGMDADS